MRSAAAFLAGFATAVLVGHVVDRNMRPIADEIARDFCGVRS